MREVKSPVIINGRGHFPLASFNSCVCSKSLSLCHFEEQSQWKRGKGRGEESGIGRKEHNKYSWMYFLNPLIISHLFYYSFSSFHTSQRRIPLTRWSCAFLLIIFLFYKWCISKGIIWHVNHLDDTLKRMGQISGFESNFHSVQCL